MYSDCMNQPHPRGTEGAKYVCYSAEWKYLKQDQVGYVREKLTKHHVVKSINVLGRTLGTRESYPIYVS